MAEESSPETLTGVWDGLYAYPAAFDPTGFTATLLQLGDSVSGTTHEVADFGPTAGQLIHATIDGRRAGERVSFTKTYEDLGPDAEYRGAVFYQGALSGDGLEIEGRWSIPGVWSGKFLMVRAGRKTAAVRKKAFAKI